MAVVLPHPGSACDGGDVKVHVLEHAGRIGRVSMNEKVLIRSLILAAFFAPLFPPQVKPIFYTNQARRACEVYHEQK